MAGTIYEREYHRIAAILSEFGFSDTDDVPLSDVLRGALVTLKYAPKDTADALPQQEQRELDAAWKAIEQGWDIESREYFEQHAPTNGFRYPLVQAIHHMWKRHLKDWPEAGAGNQA